jgi:hypothetical protein
VIFDVPIKRETIDKNSLPKELFYSNLSIHKSSTRYPHSFNSAQNLRFFFLESFHSFVHLTLTKGLFSSSQYLKKNKNFIAEILGISLGWSPFDILVIP